VNLNTYARASSLAAPTGAEIAAQHVDQRTLDIIRRRRAAELPLRRGWLIRRALLLADLIGLTMSFLLATLLFGVEGGTDRVAYSHESVLFLIALPGWVVLAKLYGLYERDEERTDHTTVDDVAGVFHLVTVGVWLFFLAVSATSIASPPLERLVAFWGLAVVSLTGGRALARAACRRSVGYLQNTIIVGAGDVGQLTARKLLSHPEYGINLVGFVDVEPKERRDDLGHLTLLGGPERLPELVHLLDVERVIVAFSNDSHEETLSLIRSLKDLDVQIDIVPRLFEVMGPKVGIHTVEGIPLVGLPPLRLSRSSRLLKRALDVVLSAFGLLVLAPFLAAIAVLIKLESPGPAFFRQVRRGAGESTFRIFKFRTMVVDADDRKHEVEHLNMHAQNGGDPRMFKVPDDPRCTRVGNFLRRSRIDEIPQLINVLKGEMSLVGPRPLILAEDQHVYEWARKRLDLKPGMTGVWQVLGASDIPFDEMTKLDYLYVTNWSLGGDLRLIFLTIPSLLRKRAAY
jgi:exopolysaccharide biosynthesis polyprenyl glycosylphosphotransferase